MSDLVECRVKLKEEELILNLKEEEKEEKFKQNPKTEGNGGILDHPSGLSVESELREYDSSIIRVLDNFNTRESLFQTFRSSKIPIQSTQELRKYKTLSYIISPFPQPDKKNLY
ncbi:hypothetical protein BFJ67_g2387 [Fusarium oxysporum f. sp. cepae]|nr:hypothetical protein BFJ67_g2387 [Fusarium oxysporum f. sp. cepae]